MRTTILYLSSREAKRHLDDRRLGPAITLLDRNHRDATIIINKRLPESVQKAFLAHEGAQLGVIRQIHRGGFPFECSCYVAHEAGLAAGRKRAEQLGVLQQYNRIQQRK